MNQSVRSVWEQTAIKRLHTDVNLRFPSTTDLMNLYNEAHKYAGLSSIEDPVTHKNSFRYWLKTLVARGYLMRLQKNLYANVSLPNYPQANEVAHLLRPSAVVSMQSVLGPAGVMNNSPDKTYAVISSDEGKINKPRSVSLSMRLNDRDLEWKYQFVSLPPNIHSAGKEEDRLDTSASYPRATLEKALCDLIFINANPRAKIRTSLFFEFDVSEIDHDRIGRLVEAMNIQDIYQDFVSKISDEDEPFSQGLGI